MKPGPGTSLRLTLFWVRIDGSSQAEHACVKTFVNILASQPVTFDDDFQEQPEKTLKRVPIVQVRPAIDPTV